MSAPAFTPGPWLVECDDGLMGCAFIPIATEAGGYLAEVTGDSAEPDELTATDRANARLIAAAPELFTALCGIIDNTDYGIIQDRYVEAARAALRKARGES